MKQGNELSWPQVVMAANAPVMTKAALVDGRTDVGVLPTGQVVGTIDELPPWPSSSGGWWPRPPPCSTVCPRRLSGPGQLAADTAASPVGVARRRSGGRCGSGTAPRRRRRTTGRRWSG